MSSPSQARFGPTSVPLAPTNLSSAVRGSLVALTWSAPVSGDVPVSYLLEAGSTAGAADLAQLDTGSAVPSLTVISVPPGAYFVRVRARTASGASAPSNEVTVIVGGFPCSQAPASPTQLTASVAVATVTLAWQARPGSCEPTAYVVEAGSASGGSDLAVFSTGNVATTFSAAGVGAGRYFVRVRASNGNGTSAPSNEVQFTVGPDPTVSAITLAFRAMTAGDPSLMVANGSSAVPIQIEVRGATGNILPLPQNLHRFANDLEFEGNDVRTAQPGTVRVKVTGYGVQSNELVITARREEFYSVIRLPIIFHVYSNSARQWTAAWTAQMVQLLNAFYRNAATNSLPNDPNAVDTFIEFYLADKDPQGNRLKIPGVDDLNEAGNVLNTAGDAIGLQYQAQCLRHMWNPTKYINVFIANQGAAASGWSLFAQGNVPAWGTVGATNTNSHWAQTSHFVMSHDALMYQPRELANVLAHELGHLLSLGHPFSQRADRTCPSRDPDGIDDTPIYDVLTYKDLSSLVVNGVPVRLYDGCNGRPFLEMNLMGYTAFHSKSFTYSQRQHMQYQLAWAYLYPTPINQGR